MIAILLIPIPERCRIFAQFVGPSPKLTVNHPKPYLPPDSVSVLPIVHVPKRVPLPDAKLLALIDKHVKWSQTRYRELLGTTFAIESKTRVFKGRYTVQQYEAFENKVGAHITAQHLVALGVNRFNCPYVLLHIFHHPTRDWPSGRAGSMNGGFNTGGGTVLIASRHFTDRPNGQSTLQHELGHAFGLPHVDAYGYPLKGNSPSIMAYNPKHHTRGLAPSRTPGRFIPEDLRGLALNDRVFGNLTFNAKRDVPSGYRLCPAVHSNGAGIYPGHLDYAIKVSTDAGSTNASRVKHVVLGKIEPSRDEGIDPKTRQPKITFNSRSMWHSDAIERFANLDLHFPFPVVLSGIRIYSGHSGKYHPVDSAQIFAVGEDKGATSVAKTRFQDQTATISFTPTESQSWRLELTPGQSKKIVIRGIRFNSEGKEIFRPGIILVD